MHSTEHHVTDREIRAIVHRVARWEHKIITLGPTDSSWRTSTKVLDAFGSDGWELVAVVPSGSVLGDATDEEHADGTLRREPAESTPQDYDLSTAEGQAACFNRMLADAGIEFVEIPVAEQVQSRPSEPGSVTAFLRRSTG